MRVHDFSGMTLLINNIPMQDFGSADSVVTLDRQADSATHVITADGKMIVSQGVDKSTLLTYIPDQTGPDNTTLSNLVLEQELEFTPVTFTFRSKNNRDISDGIRGYIKKPATLNMGVESQDRTWEMVFESADIQTLETVAGI